MSVSTRALYDSKAAKKVFELFDTNHDGIIDKEEIAVVFRKLDAERWTDARIDFLVKAFDNNSDGTIDADEFLAWIFSAEGGSAAFLLLADTAGTKIDERKCRLATCKRGCKCPTSKCAGCGLFVKIPKHVHGARDFLSSKEGIRKEADLVKCRTCLAKDNALRMDSQLDEEFAEMERRNAEHETRRYARAERLGPLALDKLERKKKMESNKEYADKVKQLRKMPMQALKSSCTKYGYTVDEMRTAMAEDEPSWALVDLIMEKEEEQLEEIARSKAAADSAAAEADTAEAP